MGDDPGGRSRRAPRVKKEVGVASPAASNDNVALKAKGDEGGDNDAYAAAAAAHAKGEKRWVRYYLLLYMNNERARLKKVKC